MTDLEKLSLDELLALQPKIAKEIDGRRSADRAKAQKEILALASRHGLAVQFSDGGTSPKSAKAKKAKGTVAVKYRHPQNSGQTWTGRGRSPAWVLEWKSSHSGSLDGIAV